MNQKNIFAAFLCSPFSWDVFVLRLDYYSPFGLLQNILVFSIEAGSKWEGTEEWHSKSRIMSLRWSGNESLEKNRWEKEGMIPRPKYYHRRKRGLNEKQFYKKQEISLQKRGKLLIFLNCPDSVYVKPKGVISIKWQ